LLAQSAAVTWSLFAGDLQEFIFRAIVGCALCLLLFLMWIGQNWVRWIAAPFFAFYGFRSVIWGVIYDNGELLLLGIGTLIVFSYLALSPAVYAFARRQRERTSWVEIFGIGSGFLLVIGSLASALLAFHIYKSGLEQEAIEFAELTFRRVFVNGDAAFLEANATDTRRQTRPREFINMIDDQLGKVQNVGPFAGRFSSRLTDGRVQLRGTVQTRAMFEAGGVWVDIEVSGVEREWGIDRISWSY